MLPRRNNRLKRIFGRLSCFLIKKNSLSKTAALLISYVVCAKVPLCARRRLSYPT
jgi:hypothetical protein